MAYVAQENGTQHVWLEEEIQEDLKWSILVKKKLFSGKSDFQSVELVESGPFGKVLLLDGKSQSAEADEFVYHELLVHLALLLHPNPKTVFIAGGGEGATAREALKHCSVEKVVMVDIDQVGLNILAGGAHTVLSAEALEYRLVVCDFCEQHLEANKQAFADPRLHLIVDDARAQLEKAEGQFDVIIGDLADPVYGGPCYQLYTQDFYRNVVAPKLAPNGIFVTQSGPAGVLTCSEVFTPINHTLRSVFPKVIPYMQHVPSYVDTWGWNMALKDASLQFSQQAEEIDAMIRKRIDGKLRFLDGATVQAVQFMNKVVRTALAQEEHIYTVDKPRFIHGSGHVTIV